MFTKILFHHLVSGVSALKSLLALFSGNEIGIKEIMKCTKKAETKNNGKWTFKNVNNFGNLRILCQTSS